MNIPSFTAEATLYNTRGHYRTSSHAINLVTQTGETIRLALGISDEGPIEVHSCRPGLIQIGEGPNIVCVDPTDPFGTRGHAGGGGPGGGSGETTDTGGEAETPPSGQTCTTRQLQSPEVGPCFKKREEDLTAGREFEHYVRCSKDKKGNPIMGCCQDYIGSDRKRHRRCTPIERKLEHEPVHQ